MQSGKNKKTGGANSNKSGLAYQEKFNLKKFFKKHGYSVGTTGTVKKNDVEIGIAGGSSTFYNRILNIEPAAIKNKKVVSWALRPDGAFYNKSNKTLYITEIKFQEKEGSADEKLLACEFRLMEYIKMSKITSAVPINKVVLIYVLNDHFKNAKYKDVLAYFKEKKIPYYFDTLELKTLGLRK